VARFVGPVCGTVDVVEIVVLERTLENVEIDAVGDVERLELDENVLFETTELVLEMLELVEVELLELDEVPCWAVPCIKISVFPPVLQKVRNEA
jgi:hypothetical protein